jgi:hypothetical protein
VTAGVGDARWRAAGSANVNGGIEEAASGCPGIAGGVPRTAAGLSEALNVTRARIPAPDVTFGGYITVNVT